MKNYALFLSVFALVFNLNSAVAALPDDLSYVGTPNPSEQQKESIQKISSLLQSKGFTFIATPGSNQTASFFTTDGIFTKAEQNTAIYVKFNVAVNVKKYFRTTIADGNKGVLYHSQTSTGVPYAVYFEGYTPNEASELVKEFEQKLGVKEAWFKHISVVSNVFAAEVNSECKHAPLVGDQDFLAMFNENTTAALKHAVDCIGKFLSAPAEIVKGVVQYTFSPKSWDDVTATWKSFRDLYTQSFKETVQKLYKGTLKLSSELQGKLFCEALKKAASQSDKAVVPNKPGDKYDAIFSFLHSSSHSKKLQQSVQQVVKSNSDDYLQQKGCIKKEKISNTRTEKKSENDGQSAEQRDRKYKNDNRPTDQSGAK